MSTTGLFGSERKEEEKKQSLEELISEVKTDPELKEYLKNNKLLYQGYRYYKLYISILEEEAKSNKILAEKISVYETKESLVKRKDRFRLLMDASLSNKLAKEDRQLYPLAFDHMSASRSAGEEGYFAAMYRAFELMLKTLHQPLTLELLVALHDMAVEDVETAERKSFSLGYADDPREINYDLLQFHRSGERGNLSKNGLIELFTDLTDKEKSPFFTLQRALSIYSASPIELDEIKEHLEELKKTDSILIDKYKLRRFGCLNKEESLRKMQELIEQYYKNIDASKGNEDAIIKAIATFCHNADLLHIFNDGNIRTLIFLVANKFLLENGFPPGIFQDPNVFDGYSVGELCEIIKTAIIEAQKYGFTSLQPKSSVSLKTNTP